MACQLPNRDSFTISCEPHWKTLETPSIGYCLFQHLKSHFGTWKLLPFPSMKGMGNLGWSDTWIKTIWYYDNIECFEYVIWHIYIIYGFDNRV